MADRLALGPEVRKLRLGDSFSRSRNKNFHHTFRYDFKPASMDTKKMATVEIGAAHQATVTVPHVEGSGTAHTVFKGSCKPYTKECVLIIDHATGDIVLEKLHSNVQLKKTRSEGARRPQPRPATPVDWNMGGPSASSSKRAISPMHHRHSPSRKPSPAPQLTVPSPNHQRSPGRCTTAVQRSPTEHPSPSMPSLIVPANTKMQSSFVPSMPLLLGGGEQANSGDASLDVGFLSDSSNDSSSSSSSSDSSGKEPEEKPPSGKNHTVPVETPSRPSSHSSSSFPSMPRFSQLTEDLHLSESGSDSDD